MVVCGGWKKFKERFLIPLIRDEIRNYTEVSDRYNSTTYENKQDAQAFYKETNGRLEDISKKLTDIYKRLGVQRHRLDDLTNNAHVLSVKFNGLKWTHQTTPEVIATQIERCKAFGSEDEPEEKLKKLSPVFDRAIIQETLDAFDFEEAAESANKLGFTSGFENKKITVEDLVKDAIEIFCKLEEDVEDGDCGRYQLGRLTGTKLWSKSEKQPWYILDYFIERSEM